MIYKHSPKAIIIAGPPASGKTTAAKAVCEQFGYSLFSLDRIIPDVASKLGVTFDELSTPHPAVISEFKAHFVAHLRELRFEDIVLEGCRVSQPHVFDAFMTALSNTHGNYTIVKCFFVNPDVEIRKKQYLLRMAQRAKQVAMSNDAGQLAHLKREHDKGFSESARPPLPGFEVVENGMPIIEYAASVVDAEHPSLPHEHKDLIKAIAESGTYNPFYQRIEVGDTIVIPGFTDSARSWTNISKLGLSLGGKKTCDIGCLHGYFSFKLEEAGALPVGVDINEGAIRVACLVAEARGSKARFHTHNSEIPFGEDFDITFALNVLHRVSDFEAVCRNMFASSKEVVVEAGESQLKELFTLSKEYGFKMGKTVKSHRLSEVIGQRVIVHIVKKEQ